VKKRNLVVANWKMNPETLEKAKEIFNEIRSASKKLKNTDVVICPPFPFINSFAKLNRPKNVFIGAQNVASQFKGAFTGEVSAEMIKNVGGDFSIIGHSERVAMGEIGETVRQKLAIAFDCGLIPVLCVGEKERDKDGNYLTVIKNQIKEYISGLQKRNLVGLIIAYEPVWAIGKSYRDAMNATDVHEMTLIIKKIVSELVGKDIAAGIKILYGGSVEAEGALPIMELGNVDGFLVGHASLNPEEFSAILKATDMKR